MVKLKGPAISTDATGTLAKTLTFSRLRRTHTLRKKPTPAQPQTGLQVSFRAMMQFLAKNWSGLTNNQQATWTQLAFDNSIAKYHAFVGHNMQRWARGATPTKAYPATEENAYATGVALNGDPGVRHYAIDTRCLIDPKDNWVGLLFHDTPDFPTFSIDKLIHVFRLDDLDHEYWTHSPLAAGWHYYRIWLGSDDGKGPGPPFSSDSGIIT